MKRSQLALAIAGLMASSASYALLDKTPSATTNLTPSTWASELKATQTSTITLPGQDSGLVETLDVKVAAGFLVPAGDVRYIRVNLSDGAQFAQTPTCKPATSGAQCTRSLGGKDNDFVTFSIAAGTAAPILASDAITFSNTGASGAVGGIRVESTANPVQMTYSLHTNKDSAESVSTPDSALIFKTGPFDFITFKPGLAISITGGSELISEVTANFLKFATATDLAENDRGVLGAFSTTPSTAGVLVPLSSTAAGLINSSTNITVIVGTGSTLEISSATPGGFSFTQDLATGGVPAGTYNNSKSSVAGGAVFLALNPANCGVNGGTPTQLAFPTALTGDKATFNLDGMMSAGTTFVCAKANGVSIIPTNQFTGIISPGSTANSTPAKKEDKFNSIKQNGTVLDTPYITTLPASQYGSRLILQNTGNAAVPYAITGITDSGVTVTLTAKATGSVPANSLLQINISDLITLSAGNRAALRIVLTGPNTSLSGVYQTIKKKPDGTTGDIQSIPLMRQGGGVKVTS